MVQEQVCSEEDRTCHARESGQTAVDSEAPAYDDDDGYEDDYDDDFNGDDIDADAADAVASDVVVDDDDAVASDDDVFGDFVDDDDDDYEPEDSCVDNHALCSQWAEAGECDKNPAYMLSSCQRSCNVCVKSGNANTAAEKGIGEMGVPKEDLQEIERLQDQLRGLEDTLAKKTKDLESILKLLTSNEEVMAKVAAAAAAKRNLENQKKLN